jgi:hypothetical protein
MDKYADIELSLHRLGTSDYLVDFRFSHPNSDADISRRVNASFDLSRLDILRYLPKEYGLALTANLFQDEKLRTAFAQARTSAHGHNFPLRLRLFIGPSAPELHNLCWELLCDPQDHFHLTTDENILFSRYLASMDWHPVRLKPKGELGALVVIANPSDLVSYNLAPVSVEEEISRARTGFEDLAISVLPDETQHATLNNIIATLRDAKVPIDILYLICHGRMVKNQPILILENDLGRVERVSGSDFITRFKELKNRPRLVMLISCQSGGKGNGDTLSALGPQLAEIGIPAILVMQDNILIETAARFLPVFIKELQRDGQIDRAISVARSMIRNQPDFWVPALYMRLKSGRLWYTPGFSEGSSGFEKFPAEVSSIKKGRCTPVLGAGMIEPLFGSMREIARRWAERFHYPLAPYERESLPQVAQYLSINQAPSFPFDELENNLKQHIRAQLPDRLLPELARPSVALNELINTLGVERRVANLNEPHRLLAELPLSIFITTNADSLLENALKEAGKEPESMICPWNEEIEQIMTIFDLEPAYEPTTGRPLVFHLFGCWNQPNSVVLTEDNYFDFLIGITSNKKLIPGQVRQALSDSGLLFLGFQTNEWNFRVLFRSILSTPGGNRRRQYTHVAAQIEPEDDRILEPTRARRYLEQYFKGADIDIYWGSAEEFLAELLKHWRKSMNEEVRP